MKNKARCVCVCVCVCVCPSRVESLLTSVGVSSPFLCLPPLPRPFPRFACWQQLHPCWPPSVSAAAATTRSRPDVSSTRLEPC